jgi:hypothetical protein
MGRVSWGSLQPVAPLHRAGRACGGRDRTVEPHDEQSALARLSLRALVPEGGDLVRPPLPLTLTLEERAARLRVCGREHDFNSYACSGRSIAFARIGDLWVTVESPTAFLDSQAFELHDEAEVNTGDEPQARSKAARMTDSGSTAATMVKIEVPERS